MAAAARSAPPVYQPQVLARSPKRGSERIISDNESFTVIVPFWAVWPFETLVIGKRHTTRLDQLNTTESTALAGILGEFNGSLWRLVPNSIPVFNGISSAADGRKFARQLALARALFSTSASLGEGPEVYGRL
jgi:galactose-1-phosphate uridylyltransferase